MPIHLHPLIAAKIGAAHHSGITANDIAQCFENHGGSYCMDSREEHRTDPPTQWFVGETNARRAIKIMFVRVGDVIHIKSAYPATAEIERIYRKYRTPES